MPTQTITTTGAGNWPIPGDCPAGTVIAIEVWGAGAGASGRVASTFGSAGAGGAYAADNYTVTAADIALGTIPYFIGAGSAGTSGADPAGGGDSTFGTFVNLLGNSTLLGGATGTPGTLPTGFSSTLNGVTQTIVGFGIDNSLGPALNYMDIQFSGTTTGTTINLGFAAFAIPTATALTASIYVRLVAGSLTNVTPNWLFAYNTWNAFSSVASSSPTVTGTLTRFSVSATGATMTGMFSAQPGWNMGVLNTTAYNFTLRFAGLMLNAGASAGTYQGTPGSYVQALGGSPPIGLVGGVGPRFSGVTGIGRTHYFVGGAGAAYNAAGSGGGGSGGKDGVGVAGSIAGVGGQGDASTGGLGGAVKTTTPGNAGTANVEGGGGGGALTTVAGTGGAGAAPGGGAGSAVIATGTGGTGARGQGRLTYIANIGALIRPPPLQIWDH